MNTFLCKAPGHEGPRDRGIKVLKETDTHLELGCEICLANKIWSVQVITRPKGWERAKWANEIRGIDRAKQVYRNQVGRVTYFT